MRLIWALVLSVIGASADPVLLQSFDAQCDGTQPTHNCRAAFQQAFASMPTGGTLNLPAGTLLLDYPDLGNNVTASWPITREKLLVVPPSVKIIGAVNTDGTPATTIQWQITSVPIFIFNKSSGAALKNVHAQFTGQYPTYFTYGDIALLKALGYPVTFPHLNQMSGGNGEMFSFVYEFDSDSCLFENLVFDSATPDNAHIFGNAFNLKGKGVITTNGGGLTSLATGNVIRNVSLEDFDMGILWAGQTHATVTNIRANHRGSVPDTAPGHVLYTTATNAYGAQGQVVSTLLSSHSVISNITEGRDTLDLSSAGGTLAIKELKLSTISNISSQHPEGVIQTLYADQYDTFTNIFWTSSYNLCAIAPSNCVTPVIYSAGEIPPYPASVGLTFKNVSLTSLATPINVAFRGNNLKIDNISIATPMEWLPGQQVTNSVLNIKASDHARITRYDLTPIITQYDPAAQYNTPFTGWNPTTNSSVQLTVDWPCCVDIPKTGSKIITGGFQAIAGRPVTGNTVSSSVVLH